MKKIFTCLVVFLIFFMASGAAFAEKLKAEDAIQLLKEWERKADEVFTVPGWTYWQYDSEMTESVKGYQFPYNHTLESWRHFNSEGLVDTIVKYVRTEAEGRKLALVHVDGFSMAYKDKTLWVESKDSPFSFGYGFASEIELWENSGYGTEIQVEDVEFEGAKAVKMEVVLYYSPFEKPFIDKLNQFDALGQYFRRWYDPETGLMLRMESYFMLTDRTVIWRHTYSDMRYLRPESLPEIVVRDIERTRSREFEKTNDYLIMWPEEPIIEDEPEEPTIEGEPEPKSNQSTMTRSVYSFNCPTSFFGNIHVQNRISFQLFPAMFYGFALSNASQPISYLGGTFLSLREFCGDALVGNHEMPGWGSGPKQSMSKHVFAQWENPCLNQQHKAGMAVRFEAKNQNNAVLPSCTLKTP